MAEHADHADAAGLTAVFVDYAIAQLRDSLWNIERCVGLLSTEQLWKPPNTFSNSIGNLVLHLTGNVRQWILDGLTGTSSDRDRPAEFAACELLPATVILPPLQATVADACTVLAALSMDDLHRSVPIQGRTVAGLVAVFHVVEHFSFHTGQIVLVTKLLTNRDLSLYDPQGKRIVPSPFQTL